ncbi:putative Dihydrolipoamide dehydrogenase [Helicobacter bizzozeronii CIII-1]|uniref:Putative Dihydrolipoamide dehydrogenase n=1 Tax=Helicobacter bizzozeronii (strain CIII-1) TaxID=1002804 RepID=F8KQT3_HELBC|nr:FAD-dependent oxidoreductase [Helicobacter bizzozeronii]CCB79087.1 putative Dihydrolipoamide dehydrogenase [Helicobacter bizzozeronii CIII-1]CCF80579.1 Putative Dihydrolipoamide dehydrogenase [Helicobacter bizzozeronii CCUG 35545]
MGFDYDLVVIGFGKGGKTLAAQSAKMGKKVALIEQSSEMYGGTCINIGCIPSKALLHMATYKKGPTGYKESIEEKNKLVAFLRQKNYETMQQAKVQVVDGTASFKDKHTLMIYHKDSCQEMSAAHIAINTGSIPITPNIPIQSSHVYDSTSLMQLSTLPSHLVVVGGGHIGLEFASMLADFGNHAHKNYTKITILMRGDTFLPKEDKPFQESIYQSLTQRGIEIVLNAQVQSIQDQHLHYVDSKSKQEHTLQADAFLLATGRAPNTEHLHVEKAGLKLGKHQEVVTNEFLVANPDAGGNIYALGDVKGGDIFSTYVSLDDFRIVSSHLYGDKSRTTHNRSALPQVLFTQTPYSHVGMRAKDIEKSGQKVLVKTIPTASIPGARVIEDTTGLLQVLVGDESKQSVLGASLHCPLSHELINVFALAINQKLGFSALKDMIYSHPSIMESFNTL